MRDMQAYLLWCIAYKSHKQELVAPSHYHRAAMGGALYLGPAAAVGRTAGAAGVQPCDYAHRGRAQLLARRQLD
jgi:hypothetical protein